MAGIKIVDLPSLGRDLLSTDLLEVSIAGTASRKITGQEIMNASKLAVGTTPIVSGTVGRLLFQGTGDVLQQSANLFWDNTSGFLGIGTSTPTAKLHVNGTSLFSSDITAYSRMDMYGGLYMYNQITMLDGNIQFQDGYFVGDNATGNNRIEFYSNRLSFYGNGTEALRIVGSTRNVLIGTTTDAGFKLDVNGTARVQGNAQFGTGFYWDATNNRLGIGTSTPANPLEISYNSGTSHGIHLNTNTIANTFNGIRFTANNANPSTFAVNNNTGEFRWGVGSGFFPTIYSSNSERLRITGTGNVLINTTTDAGFRLDVNGTARVSGAAEIITGTSFTNIRRTSTGGLGIGIAIDGAAEFRINNATKFYIGATAANSLEIPHTLRLAFVDPGQSTFSNILWSNANTQFNFVNGGNTDTVSVRFGRAISSSLGSTFESSAQLQADSTTRGFLPPRMTNAQRTAIVSPAVGLIVYCTDVTEGLWVYKSTGWTFIV